MIKSVLTLLGLLILVHAGVSIAQAQQPYQSLQQTPSLCGPGSQSVRVCGDDLRSCNSVCDARALDAAADIAGCSTRCCIQFNVCLRMRSCGGNVINCN
jgi:hypothetical protein